MALKSCKPGTNVQIFGIYSNVNQIFERIFKCRNIRYFTIVIICVVCTYLHI